MALILCWSHVTRAEFLRGKVVDAEDGLPLADVSVSMANRPGLLSLTAADGTFSFDTQAAGIEDSRTDPGKSKAFPALGGSTWRAWAKGWVVEARGRRIASAPERGADRLPGPVAKQAAISASELSFARADYQAVSQAIDAGDAGTLVKMAREKIAVWKNDRMEARFERATGLLSLSAAGGADGVGGNAAPFLKSGNFGEGGGSAKLIAIRDSVFGEGMALEIRYPSGNLQRLSLFDRQPFLFLQKTLAAAVSAQARAIKPFQASLGLPSAGLKTNGSGGLMGPYQTSYAYLAIADPATRQGVVAGWLTDWRGSGLVATQAAGNDVGLSAQLDYGKPLPASASPTPLEIFALGFFPDARLGLEAYADAAAKLHRVRLPACPVVYDTWYHVFGAWTESELLGNAAFLKKNLGPFGVDVVQIDDGWQGDHVGDAPKKEFSQARSPGYPDGMKSAADKVKALGFRPGLWFMPFAADGTAPQKEAWYAHNPDGSGFRSKWGGYSLDMSNPDARAYSQGITARITKDWGFGYVKIDGDYTAMAVENIFPNDGYNPDDYFGRANFADAGKTPVEVFRDGMKLVRGTVGPEVFILGCTISQNMRTLASSYGLIDAMRVNTDNNATWDEWMNSPRQAGQRYFLHGRVWYNDPDPAYLRMGTEEARTTYSWAGLSGVMLEMSEDFRTLQPELLDIAKRSIPNHGRLPRPADFFDDNVPQVWLLTDTLQGKRRDVAGFFNFNGQGAVDYALDKLGLAPAEAYVGFDFWSNRFLDPIKGRIQLQLAPHGCKIIALRPLLSRPQLLSTSRHVSQGMVDVEAEDWDGQVLSGKSKVIGGDDYELRIAAQNGPAHWTAKSASVAAADTAAGVKVSFTQQDAWVRVLVKSMGSREVTWAVHFQ